MEDILSTDYISRLLYAIDSNDNDSDLSDFSIPCDFDIDIVNFNKIQRMSFYLNDITWKMTKTLYNYLITNFINYIPREKFNNYENVYDNLDLARLKLVYFDKLKEELNKCADQETYVIKENYEAVTKEISIYENEKIFVTVPTGLINYALEKDLDDNICNITKFAMEKLVFNCVEDFFKNQLKIDSVKQGTDFICDAETLSYKSYDSDIDSDYDDFYKVDLPIVFSNFVYYVTVSLKLKVLLKITGRKVLCNTIHTGKYYQSQNCLVKLGNFNLTDEQVNSLKPGQVLDINQPLSDEGEADFYLYLKERKAAQVTAVNVCINQSEYKVMVQNVITEDKKENENSYVLLGTVNIEENEMELKENDIFNLDSFCGDFLPLIHNNKIVALVYLLPVNNKLLVRVVKIIN